MSRAFTADLMSEGRCNRKRCLLGRLTRSSWPTQPTTPIICGVAPCHPLPKAPRRHPQPTPVLTGAQISARPASLCPSPSRGVMLLKTQNIRRVATRVEQHPKLLAVALSLRPSSYGCDVMSTHLTKNWTGPSIRSAGTAARLHRYPPRYGVRVRKLPFRVEIC